MDNVQPSMIGDDFPAPRALRPTSEEWRANNLSRYVYLSNVRRQCKPAGVKSRTKAVVIVALAIVGLLLASNVFSGLLVSSGFLAPGNSTLQATSAATAEAYSTPRHLWMRGTMPTLYQVDPEWADKPYAEGTVATHGCGPTCLSMVYVQLTGKRDMDPMRMAEFSEREGYIDSGVTSWLFMSEGAQKLGLRVQELSANIDMVRAQLRAGNPVICTVGPGDFTQDGHFIALCGVDEEGRFIVHDPNSAERTQQPWDAERVLSQCRNLWAFAA